MTVPCIRPGSKGMNIHPRHLAAKGNVYSLLKEYSKPLPHRWRAPHESFALTSNRKSLFGVSAISENKQLVHLPRTAFGGD